MPLALNFIMVSLNINYVNDAYIYISMNMKEKIIQENVLMPIYKAREINNVGINWLSKKSGRTIREKMSGSKSIMAVKHRMSFDSGENRLFLAFAKNIYDMLQLKLDNLPENFKRNYEDDFFQKVMLFIRSDQIFEIKKWENTPPNNTLLSDRHYRKIWNAWNQLQKLDDIIKNDYDNISNHLNTIIFFEFIVISKSIFSFPQVPITLDYEKFSLDIKSKYFCGFDNFGNTINLNVMDNGFQILYNNNQITGKLDYNILTLTKNNIQCPNINITIENIYDVIEYILFLLCDIYEITYYKPENISINCNKVIIDIFSIKPNILLDNDTDIKTINRILCQKHDEYYLSGSISSTLMMSSNIKTYSIKYSINNSLKEPMNKLIHILKKTLKSNKLIFTFPDVYNEFQLSILKKSLRLCYNSVISFPKSIGILFYYQTLEKYKLFQEEDFALLVDYINNEITFTLVKGHYDENLLNEIDTYKGIVWERYPTISIPFEKLYNNAIDMLVKNGFENAEEILDIFSIQDLLNECDNLSIYLAENNDNLKILHNFMDYLDKLKLNIDIDINNFISKHKTIIGKSKIHVIILSNHLVYSGNLDYIRLTDSSNIALKGYQLYEELYKKTNISLWCDHLPNLSIKKLYGTFDLVKNATIHPSINFVQDISIDNTYFTLPKGKKEYKFNLVQNDGNSKNEYVAYIKNNAFPLKTDVKCKLKMTYNYGADDSYSLIFEPINKKMAGFSQATVEWNLIEEFEYNNLPYPMFPSKKSWSDFENYPKKNEDGTNNLLDWIKNDFEYLTYYNSQQRYTINLKDYNHEWQLSKNNAYYTTIEDIYLNGENYNLSISSRNFDYPEKEFSPDINTISFYLGDILRKNNNIVTIDLSDYDAEWIHGSKGWYCYINDYYLDDNYISIGLFEDNIKNPDNFEFDDDIVSFKLYGKNGKYRGRDIINGEPTIYYMVKNVRKNNLDSNMIFKFRKFLFPLHTIFFDGRSINEVDCPSDFRNCIKNFMPILLKSYASCDYIDIDAKIMLLKSVCLLAKDYDYHLYEVLNEDINQYKNNKIKLNDSI